MTTNKNNLVHTEIGLYPADWTIIRVKELFSEIKRGYVLPVSATKSRPSGESIFPVYSSQTANNGVMGFYDTYLYEDAITWTTDGANAGDVHFRAGKFYCTNVCGVLISKEGFANRCTAEAINRVSRNHVSYIGNPKLMNNVMAEIQIAIPSNLEEQLRIAKALSTIDAYIKSLDDFIVKKRQIKEGLMQQLLTGKTRLPGFSGEWLPKNLGKSALIKARIGWQGLTTKEYLDSGVYYLITGTDFKDGRIDWKNCHYVTRDRFEQDPYIKIQKHDVLVSKDGTIGKVAYLDDIPGPGTLNSGVFVIRSKDKQISQRYLAKVFVSKYFDDFIDSIVAGSTIVHLYQKDIVKFDFMVPPSIKEQEQVCDFLEGVDKEIICLESKRDKYASLKQGMMQELLTGKTRL